LNSKLKRYRKNYRSPFGRRKDKCPNRGRTERVTEKKVNKVGGFKLWDGREGGEKVLQKTKNPMGKRWKSNIRCLREVLKSYSLGGPRKIGRNCQRRRRESRIKKPKNNKKKKNKEGRGRLGVLGEGSR